MKTNKSQFSKDSQKNVGERLYRVIDAIDPKWIALADTPKAWKDATCAKSAIQKSRLLTAVLLLLIFLLPIGAASARALLIYAQPYTYGEYFYQEFAELYGTEMTAETYEELLTFREQSIEYIMHHNSVADAARRGKISLEEYRTYMERYRYLEPRMSVLNRFIDDAADLFSPGATPKESVSVIFTTPWERFFDGTRIIFLLSAISISLLLSLLISEKPNAILFKKKRYVVLYGTLLSVIFLLTDLLLFLCICHPEGTQYLMHIYDAFSAMPHFLTFGISCAGAILLSILISVFTSLFIFKIYQMRSSHMIRTQIKAIKIKKGESFT